MADNFDANIAAAVALLQSQPNGAVVAVAIQALANTCRSTRDDLQSHVADNVTEFATRDAAFQALVMRTQNLEGRADAVTNDGNQVAEDLKSLSDEVTALRIQVQQLSSRADQVATDGSKVTEQVVSISNELSGFTSDLVNYVGEVDTLRKLAIERTDWLKATSDTAAQELRRLEQQLQQQQQYVQQLAQAQQPPQQSMYGDSLHNRVSALEVQLGQVQQQVLNTPPGFAAGYGHKSKSILEVPGYKLLPAFQGSTGALSNAFRKFSTSFIGCAVSAHGPEARKAMALARESPGEVSQALEEEHSGLNEDLWSALSHKLDGVAWDPVLALVEGRGLELWRRVHKEHDPQNKEHAVVL